MKDAQMTMTSRGGYMAKGKCSVCGCGMCRIMSKDNAEKAVKDGEAKAIVAQFLFLRIPPSIREGGGVDIFIRVWVFDIGFFV